MSSPGNQSDVEVTERIRRRIRFCSRIMIASAIAIAVSLIGGIAATAIKMVEAFKDLSTSVDGDPAKLATGISEAMKATYIGIISAVVFALVFVLSLSLSLHLKNSASKINIS